MVKSADAPPPPVSESQATTQRSSSPASVQQPSPPTNSVELIPSTEHTQQQIPTDPTSAATGTTQISVSGYNASHLPKLNILV